MAVDPRYDHPVLANGIPNGRFARHRDLSSNPIAEFRRMFQQLNLPYGLREEVSTRHYCMAETSQTGYAGDEVVRNSAQNMKLWQRLLTEAELDRIREKCLDIARVSLLGRRDGGDRTCPGSVAFDVGRTPVCLNGHRSRGWLLRTGRCRSRLGGVFGLAANAR